VTDVDPFRRRLERTAVAVCLGMAVLAVVLAGGRLAAGVGVLAGGLLTGVSYWTISLVVFGEKVPWSLARVALRYALLALLAYVMIARLRLHPWGLLAGASSVVAAVSVEAVRLLMPSASSLRKKS
jgi:hypothetical protein